LREGSSTASQSSPSAGQSVLLDVPFVTGLRHMFYATPYKSTFGFVSDEM
jgi:hypothetical protein